ncbi:hypothetical protein D1AOALGA4SA_10076 [Olavius algarvensis Delta 1 endosymbiont]|nr:hypothetical protein D1AOALGA4SA_10076 [Olavius algarvensis Delta 1 endosymbiont]
MNLKVTSIEIPIGMLFNLSYHLFSIFFIFPCQAFLIFFYRRKPGPLEQFRDN